MYLHYFMLHRLKIHSTFSTLGLSRAAFLCLLYYREDRKAARRLVSNNGSYIFYLALLCWNIIDDFLKYSQLSRKRPPLVHDKVVAYGRWSLTRSGRYERVDCITLMVLCHGGLLHI